MPNEIDSIPFITVRTVAEILDVRPKTVYAWIREDFLLAHRLPSGREYRICRTDWELFKAAHFPSAEVRNKPTEQVKPQPPAEPTRQMEEQPPVKRRGRDKNFYALGADRPLD